MIPRASLAPVLIPDADSHFALYAATCLGRLGHPVHALSAVAMARIRFSRYCTSFTTAPAGAPAAERLGLALRALDRVPAGVVLPVSESGCAWTAEHRATLARSARIVDLPDAGALSIAGHKARLAAFLHGHGIPHPETRALAAGADALAAAGGLGLPLLWKPAVGSGGRGIVRLADAAALKAFARAGTREDGVLQREIPGDDWDASALCRDGELLAWSVHRPLPAGARGFAPATAIAFEEDAAVLDATRRAARALRWSGVMNLDLRRDRNGLVHVLEINPRYWSSLLGSCAAGVHFPHLACLAAAGVPFAPPRARPRRYIQAGTALRLVARGPRAGRPAFGETTAPALIGDPLPYVAGHVASGIARLAGAGRPRRRAA